MADPGVPPVSRTPRQWAMIALEGSPIGKEQQSRRPRRRFSEEFKRDAVGIVRSSGKSIAEVARELGIYDSLLGSWVRQDQVNRGEREGLSSDEREELVELRRENARLLRMERELLKRATAFWVRESKE